MSCTQPRTSDQICSQPVVAVLGFSSMNEGPRPGLQLAQHKSEGFRAQCSEHAGSSPTPLSNPTAGWGLGHVRFTASASATGRHTDN